MAKNSKPLLLDLDPRQQKAIALVTEEGLLPELIEGLSANIEKTPSPRSTRSSAKDSAVMAEYRAMYPGRSTADLVRLLDET